MRLLPLATALLIAVGAPAMADPRGDSMRDYARANTALLHGKPRVARIELLNAIAANPSNGAAHLMQGLVYIRLGDGVAAAAEIVRARETGLAVNATRHLMAEALLLQHAPARAVDEADPAGVAPLYQAWAARVRGQAHAALGDQAAAAEDFARAARLGPRDPAVWADVGRFRATAGEAAGALAAAQRAVALDPHNVSAVVLGGELVRSQYGLVAALPWFDRALAIDPSSVAALLDKAATLGDIGRMGEMLATTRAVLAIDDDNPTAFYLQAVLAARARNFPLARSLLARTAGAMDDVPAAMLLGGAVDYQTGNVGEAIAKLRRLIALQPDNLKARRILGAAQWRAGDLPGTIETLRPVADQPGADSYTLTLIGRALERQGERAPAAAYLDRAALPLPDAEPSGSGDPGQVDALRRTLSANPDNPDARSALARALIRDGRARQGLDEARILLRADPRSPAALVLAGDAFTAARQYPQAAEAYRRAANISFTEPVALRMIDALRRAGRADAATQVLSIFLAQNPRSVPARLLAADLAMAGGGWEQATSILESLRRQLGDRDAALLNNLAWAYFESGRPAQALPLAAAAHGLVPANPAVADTFGWLLLASKADPARGLALVEQAAAQAPGNAGVRWHLAQAYAASGRRAEARAAAQAALALPGLAERGRAAALLAKLS